ncbi:MAG: UbiH/UbiF/VisC/COQ6 family ubiquinone biosynthesis hydroxylase [Sphingomonadales bacterium]
MLRIVDVQSPANSGRKLDADLFIVGGGMVGLTLARCCAAGGLRAVVVDSMDLANAVDAGFDGRCSAIAFSSRRLLSGIGVWPLLAAGAEPIREIRVSDGASARFLHFDHRDIGEAPLGFMVENRHLRDALMKVAGSDPDITVLAPEKVTRIERHASGVNVALDSGRRVSARLVVGADGRRSQVRRAAGIRTVNWRYRQIGIVTTVAHEQPHHGIAQEHFLPAGPFAILPLTGNRSSLVWTEHANLAPSIMGLEQAAFDSELARRFGDYLGSVVSVGPRWSYPLALHHAHRYIGPGLALVGDAAHGIHPIAGQGLNLGFRDIAVLAEVLTDSARIGLDIGTSSVLERYQQWRRFDVVVMAAVTDGLNRLFSNDLTAVRLIRDFGLGVVNQTGPLKRFFMHHARGTVGKLPRLLAGKPL